MNRTPTLMVQGTTSNAGKSVLAAGLCRLFRDAGMRVAPFKPQNMALNSAVTIDGGEIGRSQAVQARAAGVEPHTDMNPVLLKPNSDRGAQVIVQGHAVGSMDAVAYHAYKAEAKTAVMQSYHRLCGQYDLIVVEGAGSPAEINLRQNDIANMGFALAADAVVVLVADIDRGGVFAHLTGTMDCLSEREQELVGGFVINRFRGDRALLEPGIEWLSRRTGVPTLGVLPYLKGLHIEAEDAVDRRSAIDGTAAGEEILRVVVPRIPRISNHTDFDVLRLHPRVDLRYVDEGETAPAADLIILPGSKNTVADLDWLRRHGWSDVLKRHLRYGGKLIGICGGYQMLGKVIHDPDGIEGAAGSTPGLGLMDYETVLEPVKQLERVRGRLNLGGEDITGYEIHMGSTRGPDLERPAVSLDGRTDGAISGDGQILCCYLHGLFDHPEACAALLRWSGLNQAQGTDYAALVEREIDRVAQMLREELDQDGLCALLGVGPVGSQLGARA